MKKFLFFVFLISPVGGIPHALLISRKRGNP